MAETVKRLSALRVQREKRPGYYADGGGLYLQVTSAGGKSWIFRYRVAGDASANGKPRSREMGLGSLREVSLEEAREAAGKWSAHKREGRDPIAVRREELRRQAVENANGITFEAAALEYIEGKKDGWRNEKHRNQWSNTLRDYAYPIIGTIGVRDLTIDDIAKVIRPIWLTKNETASRVQQRIAKVLDWAKVKKYRNGDNPAVWRGNLEHMMPERKKVRKVEHHPALPYAQIGGFMQKLRARGGMTAEALEYLILVAARTSEVTGMREREVDLQAATWTVPGERMKMEVGHVVPLSRRAAEILEKRLTGDPDHLVFPGTKKGKGLSDMTLAKVHRSLGKFIDPTSGRLITTHGFRSTFRDWVGDCTEHPRELAEMAIAHKVDTDTEAAYRRSKALEKRRALMNDWANYCATPPEGDAATDGNVVSLRKAQRKAG